MGGGGLQLAWFGNWLVNETRVQVNFIGIEVMVQND
jgi:hypothetical protein